MALSLEFIICSILIFLSSHYISRYGKSLSIKIGWHEGFIGVVFLAAATSLPELFTSISTVPLKKIDLGFGDAIGSLIINLMLIGLLDYFHGRGRILLHAKKENILTGVYTLFSLGVLGLFTFLRHFWLSGFYFFGIGIESFIIIGIYFMGMRSIFSKRHGDSRRSQTEDNSYIWYKFLAFFLVIILLGFWLANIGKRISDSTNINQTFIGTLMLAFSTSLPELAVSWSSLKAGSIDMAIANILGSNFFDVCIIPLMDFVRGGDPVLGIVAPINILTIAITILMTGIVILGLSIRSKDTKRKMGWDTILILLVGIFGYYFIYRFG